MRPKSSTRQRTCGARWPVWRSVVCCSTAAKSAVIVCCAAIATTACSFQATSTQPSTAPPTSRVDSLIVSIEDVRRIANYEELAAHFQTDLREPPEADTNVPGPCRVVGSSDRTFGTDWSEFRSAAGYHGVTDDLRPGGPVMVETVSQAIALYPDPSTARGVFHRLESSLAECAGLHDPYFDFILDRPDASTVRIGAAGWSHVYRLKSSVFISVGVLGIEPAEPIANVILQTISDRIQ